MALQLRRGTNAERLAITPAVGELIYVTNATAAGVPALWVGDGTTAGGIAATSDTLAGLNDVQIFGTPSDQVPLVYDSGSGKWGNLKGLTVYGENNNPTANSNYINFTGEYSGAGSVDVGFGAGLQINLEDTAGNIVGDAGEFIVAMTDKTLNAESYKISLEVTHGGVPSVTALETSKTDTKIAGDLTINYDEDYASAAIYAKTNAADSILSWDGTASIWRFYNQFGLADNNTTTPKGVQGVVGNDDYWFLGGYASAGSNTGAMVIASGNNGNEPIYVRQYTGSDTTQPFPGSNTVARELTLLDASGNTTLPGSLRTDSSEDVANAGAISLNTAVSYFSTGATGETATLAAGSAGQFKSLMMVADGGGDMVITVTNAGWQTSGTGTLTFNVIGDSCLLQYISSKWFAIGANGVTFG